MKNAVFVNQTRNVRNPNTGKIETYTKGEIRPAAQLLKAFNRLPEWVEPMTELQAQIIRSNRSIDEAMKSFNIDACTIEEKANIDLVGTYLIETLGLEPSDFSFGRNVSLAFKDSTTDTVWVGVKMASANNAFIGRNGKRVSLQLNNWISINTFVARTKSNQPLFLGQSI